MVGYCLTDLIYIILMILGMRLGTQLMETVLRNRCIRVTDVGVIAIAESCTSLEFLSLFGIIGVTDKCLEALQGAVPIHLQHLT
ncbi:F-box protein At3g58530 [Linum perenne]